jgi:hypothetical protein
VSERTTVGFDRGIEREWLDAVAGKLASGGTPAETREMLWRMLESCVVGDTLQSARGKTATVLSRIWIKPPKRILPLRSEALGVLTDEDADGRMALHWAMMIAAYPFFADVADIIGRIGKLNGEVSVGQVARRTKELWGDRSTLPPAIQRLVRSMSKWGILVQTSTKGLYQFGCHLNVHEPRTASILAKSMLHRNEQGMRVQDILRSPTLFPFIFNGLAANPRSWEGVKICRQGDLSDYVELDTVR